MPTDPPSDPQTALPTDPQTVLRRTDLTAWTLRATAGPVPDDLVARDVPAAVPGTSHTALLDAGLIPDPYLDDNEQRLAWMRDADWRYSTPLRLEPAAPGERVDLVLGGVDTVGVVRLGDRELGTTANMHRTYRFDVRDLADGTERTLAVDLRSALAAGLAEAERIGARPCAYDRPLNMVRKMACSFGWDWGPDLETAGLWKPVTVERWRTARLREVRPLVTVDGLDAAPFDPSPADPARSVTPPSVTALVRVHVDVERSGLLSDPAADAPLAVRATLAGASGTVTATGTVPAGATGVTLDLHVPQAVLWWPVGYGDPVLHDLDVELCTPGAPGTPAAPGTAPDDLADDPVLDRWHRRVGLRSVSLDTTPDEHGTPFTLVVNGRPVFVRGANWIPDDHLLTRITRERLAARVEQGVGAHLNLLRVWGGGIYESDDFYDVCDERGVLVWQDFLLACAAYPEEEPHRSELEAEARENVVRLMTHPSLVVWNGGNENLWGFMDWGWQEALDGATWGYGYCTDLFPQVLAELDPTRPYATGSPYSPGEAPWERHPNDPDHGTHHEWEVWNRVDYTHYRDDVPRFCSEFGFQGPPTWATLQRAVRPADGTWSADDAVWLVHQKADDGNGKLDRGMAPHLGVPDDFDAWAWAAQLNQARAVAYAVEHYRAWWPRTAGAIVWQLNDCWPVTSWAAVDGDGRAKPVWFALRRAMADRALSVTVRDGVSHAALVNDTDEAWTTTLTARRTTLAGDPLASEETPVAVAPRSVGLVALGTAPDGPLVSATDPAGEVLVLDADGVRAVHTFAEDVDLALDPQPLAAAVHVSGEAVTVTVEASSLARGVTLLVDRVWPTAQVDDGVVDLPGGAQHVFRVTFDGPAPDDLVARADELTGPLVLRTANAVVGAAARA